MRTKHTRITFSILITAFFVTLMLLNFTTPVLADHNANVPMQASPTPTIDSNSEIGSTDGILIMGIVIVLIVTVPLLLHKKK